METTTKVHQYKTIYAWRHAANVKATNRRLRKQSKGQRPRYMRIGGRWTRTTRARCSHSWRH